MKTEQGASPESDSVYGLYEESAPMPVLFECIDPSQTSLVFDFFAGFRRDEKVEVLAHLGLCLHCREVAEMTLKLTRGLEGVHYFLHAYVSDEGESEEHSRAFTEMAS